MQIGWLVGCLCSFDVWAIFVKNSNLLSYPSLNSRIGEPFIELFTIDSTNNYAMGQVHEGLASHGAVYIAEDQTAGKGQRHKSWVAEPGENITMSCVLEPEGPNLTRPFLLSAGVALACLDFFNDFTNGDVSIKWPNDIYWRDRKAGGILIENVYRANQWQFAIAGIGLNINQTSFSPALPNPVSLKQITGRHNDRIALAKELCRKLDGRYAQFLNANSKLLEEYNSKLYRLGEKVRLKKDNIIFETEITGTSVLGQLLTQDAMERQFEFGEVEWLM
jgi:BirA family transcriptional regulator, biotin operon repressor / biotin---[acetyl-CoA-carboxylase] ligase